MKINNLLECIDIFNTLDPNDKNNSAAFSAAESFLNHSYEEYENYCLNEGFEPLEFKDFVTNILNIDEGILGNFIANKVNKNLQNGKARYSFDTNPNSRNAFNVTKGRADAYAQKTFGTNDTNKIRNMSTGQILKADAKQTANDVKNVVNKGKNFFNNKILKKPTSPNTAMFKSGFTNENYKEGDVMMEIGTLLECVNILSTTTEDYDPEMFTAAEDYIGYSYGEYVDYCLNEGFEPLELEAYLENIVLYNEGIGNVGKAIKGGAHFIGNSVKSVVYGIKDARADKKANGTSFVKSFFGKQMNNKWTGNEVDQRAVSRDANGNVIGYKDQDGNTRSYAMGGLKGMINATKAGHTLLDAEKRDVKDLKRFQKQENKANRQAKIRSLKDKFLYGGEQAKERYNDTLASNHRDSLNKLRSHVWQVPSNAAQIGHGARHVDPIFEGYEEYFDIIDMIHGEE